MPNLNFSTHQKAFSLIELMVVVAILSILSAFAVPAYQDYIIRTRVTEAIAWVEPIKKQIADNAYNGAPLLSTINLTTINSKPLPKALKRIDITDYSGLITLVFKGGPIEGKYLYIVLKDSGSFISATPTATPIPTGRLSWSCRSAEIAIVSPGSVPGTLPGKYAPPWCNETPVE